MVLQPMKQQLFQNPIPFPPCIFLSCHLSAFFGAAVARLGTLLAMLHMRVFATFITTSLAQIGTNAADILSPAAAQAHKLCSGITQRRTFHIELNAARHHLDILLLRAGRSAMVADGSTSKTRIDTGFVGVITSHKPLFKSERR
jgi:hypothetical protein